LGQRGNDISLLIWFTLASQYGRQRATIEAKHGKVIRCVFHARDVLGWAQFEHEMKKLESALRGVRYGTLAEDIEFTSDDERTMEVVQWLSSATDH
jgi:hypothetical protein